MAQQLSEEQLKALAQQLSHPKGEDGVQLGKRMNVTNDNMIRKTIESLPITDGAQVLEIGHGNAHHLPEFLHKAANIQYVGLEVSQTMYEEAQKENAQTIAAGQARFLLTDGTHIPAPDAHFDIIFSVNTVYFWQNPVNYIREIGRVLKSGGYLCLSFVEKDSMQKLAFTQYGFSLYDTEGILNLVKNIPHQHLEQKHYTEETFSNIGQKVERTFGVLLLQKL
ncbi:Methyltransferase domain-containing protein [Flexibacter flexilis DSM 6793]|uniref:Methyltransferase domain-containing protein n=1 Tax=Flexibacter flexilis DSM 6793 TaxID=927664 RepID=A0A1I1JJ86_9BACT|nr:class I SAM-dependent methyltransferase [Flexibacter flexilis]SFC48679.1 Methyltransferase domain-containing protein [Flexibacter flexilis DSM 6793]